MLNYGKLSIVVGAGNEGDKAGHAKVMLDSDEEKAVELAIGPYQAPFFLQIWKRFEEEAVIWLRSPSGEEVPLSEKERQAVFRVGKVRITVSSLEPTPYMRRQAFLVAFASEESYLSAGIWKFYMKRRQKRPMQIDLWLPANGQLQEKTEFLEPSPETTVTIPGTASRVITVGAYDARFGQMASFSGRGYPTFSVEIKPEIVAPGVEVLSASPGGGYTFRSGTSMATPFVSGAAALLMEWGIVKGQDVFLYADRLKAFLLRGAQPLPGNEQYPNPISGWGRLCIRKSRP
ncbi:MAG: hypothetical protein E7277_04185 [Lachnospiraceae bacterium]|nr:hypothetical protein [Lachnospiraceae bacterium]